MSTSSKRRKSWPAIVALVAMAIGASLLAAPRFFAVHWLLSDGMQPTYEPGERLIANRFAYTFSAPARGDVVLFIEPECFQVTDDCGDAILVGRVVGVAGDTIARRSGRIFRNGRKITEEPRKREWITLYQLASRAKISVARETGERGMTYDIGIFHGENDFYDSAETTVPSAHLFVLGDNRDFGYNSGRLGVIPASMVVGKVFVAAPSIGKMPAPVWIE